MPNQEASKLLNQGDDAFMRKALKMLYEPLDTTEKNELNVPKQWNAQKERIANIIVVIDIIIIFHIHNAKCTRCLPSNKGASIKCKINWFYHKPDFLQT